MQKALTMKRYKVKQVLDLLRADGWVLKGQKGSHRQFFHPNKKGKVTVNGKESDTVDQFLLNTYTQTMYNAEMLTAALSPAC